MRFFIAILVLLPLVVEAQDRVFFRDGSSKKGTVVSIGKDQVYFRASDTSATEKFNKAGILLIEDYKGKVYLFSEKKTEAVNERLAATQNSAQAQHSHRNMLTAQPLGLMFGRANLNYERLSKDQKIGVSIPFSLTFDPTGLLSESDLDTSANSVQRIKGVSYITGIDVHFYIGTRERPKFYVGPRFRYGTDLFLRNTNGYSLQTELGLLLAPKARGFTQSFSVGFGFVRLISAPSGLIVDPKQSYGWLSLNYKLGLKW